MNRIHLLAAVILGAAALASAATAQEKKTDEAAVARARKTAMMLDDVYKNAIVLITDKYVNKEDDFAAGAAAVQLFQTISDKGWHNVRLVDATGDPYDAENVAKDDFEKKGIVSLKEGKATVEQVVEKDGKPFLRVMTPVPVVMKKCIMCHPQYENAKKGEPIGAISYSIPIE
jgi:hypothetical protein